MSRGDFGLGKGLKWFDVLESAWSTNRETLKTFTPERCAVMYIKEKRYPASGENCEPVVVRNRFRPDSWWQWVELTL